MMIEPVEFRYNQDQHLDLYLQDQTGRPLVVCVHGGGFISGDKRDIRCRQSVELLTGAGFNCASVSYSLAPADNRFQMWPRNLFDLADALDWLNEKTELHGYDFKRLGLLGFSAGCCLSNLYIQGGETLFRKLGHEIQVFDVSALVGFYGPYDFPSRQPERRSQDDQLNREHSPAYWFKRTVRQRPPVLHIQGNRDRIVYPQQHEMFQADYEGSGLNFEAIVVDGAGHSFAPLDTTKTGQRIDLGRDIIRFFSTHLV
jgi:acetyl esterase/lipase